MRNSIARASAIVAAGAVAGTLGVTGISAAGAATRAPHPAKTSSSVMVHRLAVPGAKLWVKRYNGPKNGSDVASSVAISPGGGKVFVTGTSTGATSFSDYLTVAYNAATGARLWTARYNGPGNGLDNAAAVAVSPDGATVFVTGDSEGGPGFEQDYATVAYRASDGKQLWVARFNGQPDGIDIATAVSVARDGAKVFVTGTSADSEVTTSSWATVAYNASDGAQLWVARLNGPAGNTAAAAITSPGGNRVFVTGEVQSKAITAQYGTVAYNATTGARLWARRYAGQGATAIAVSPDRTKVYVTGTSHDDFTTLAYRARTGARLWVRRYPGPGPTFDFANAMAVSPAGTVLVTGSSRDDYATVAYSPAGAQLWARRYNGPGINPPPADADSAFAVAAPGNGRVYVTGASWGGKATKVDYATVAYNARTGARLWVRRYNGPASRGDSATALAAGGGRVFVTGGSAGIHSGDDYATIAYRS